MITHDKFLESYSLIPAWKLSQFLRKSISARDGHLLLASSRNFPAPERPLEKEKIGFERGNFGREIFSDS